MEFDVKETDYKKLEYLRRHTVLGPIAKLKIEAARVEAMRVKKLYEEVENETIELDTSIADSLEYDYRMRAMENKVGVLWAKHGDGLGLSEFADMIVEQELEKDKKKERVL